MSYDTQETSVHAGEPFECYRFTQGSRLWLFTSADRDITIPAGVFLREVISRGEIEHSEEDLTGSLQITVARTNPIVAQFIAYVPLGAPSVTIYRGHRGHESEAGTIFTGQIVNVGFSRSGSEAIMPAAPITRLFKTRIPKLAYQVQCNWPLFSAGCGLNKGDWEVPVTVTTVSGNQVVSNDFAAQTDGWFNNGWLQRSDGDVRFIVEHVGNTVTLMNPFPDLASLEAVSAYPGCMRTEEVCGTAKFNNLEHHLGFARVPWRNPHEMRVG